MQISHDDAAVLRKFLIENPGAPEAARIKAAVKEVREAEEALAVAQSRVRRALYDIRARSENVPNP